MLGVGRTVNEDLLLLTPLAFTTTLPVVAPVGTVATIDVAPQLVIGGASCPVSVSIPVPSVASKNKPAIVTEAPTAPDVSDRLAMLSVGNTVNEQPLLF